jgi:hypothetical protein
MSTAIVTQPLISSGSRADREARAKTLATLFVKFLGDHVDLLVQVRQDFLGKPKGETIMDCHTWGQYCANVLHYSESHIRSLIAERNPATLIHGAPVPSNCPLCGKEFPSKGQRGRHIRDEHPDQADEVLGKQQAPQGGEGKVDPVYIDGHTEPFPDAPPSLRDPEEESAVPPSAASSNLSIPLQDPQGYGHDWDEVHWSHAAHGVACGRQGTGKYRLKTTKDTSQITCKTCRAVQRKELKIVEYKKVNYKKGSYHTAIAPKEPEPTEVFYVIQRKDTEEFLYSSTGKDYFRGANVLLLVGVRRFPTPEEYTCVYYVPKGKYEEQELDRKEWQWVKVQITMEPLESRRMP